MNSIGERDSWCSLLFFFLSILCRGGNYLYKLFTRHKLDTAGHIHCTDMGARKWVQATEKSDYFNSSFAQSTIQLKDPPNKDRFSWYPLRQMFQFSSNDLGWGKLLITKDTPKSANHVHTPLSLPPCSFNPKQDTKHYTMSLFYNFLFPLQNSIFITVMCIITPVLGAISAYSEIIGNHLQYSKFSNPNSQANKKQTKLSSRSGMLIAYTPAFLAGIFALWFYSDNGFRFLLVDFALTIHFFKRIFEVLCIHKYSGSMGLGSIIPISIGYFLFAVTTLYSQHLTYTLPEPQLDLKYAGVALFLLGIFGNLYHHIILSKLRKKDNKGYKIPKGGLFDLVTCPHYLFEILVFIAICLISQTIYPLCNTVSTILYLTARSYETKKWYLSKFQDFPKDVKALIPYVF